MTVGNENQVTVAFPADPRFRRLARVTVAGLALRLGFDVARVESLRAAVDLAATELGEEGRVTVTALWQEDLLELVLDNPDADLSDEQQLAIQQKLLAYCDTAEAWTSRVKLTLDL